MENRRIIICKGILWTLAGLAAAVATVRFVYGLGVATALSDTTPWGLWIGFDVMGGVALAAGGFVVAAIVHIFHREKYRSVARPAILTAFLGYAAVAVGLLFDLGLPWHIWHPVVFWNIRSALFEVAWCVMLYLTVLALEVSPVILERTPFQKACRLLKRLTLPIMILGIMLSTLHQSSLGSLLLIMPFRLHPLWYTSMLPELFFVSAICLGLVMVMFESSVTSWLYRRKPETETLAGLAGMAVWALGFYLVFRLVDLARLGHLGLVFQGSRESALFLLEMLMSAVVPIALFSIPPLRRSPAGIWAATGISVLGFVFNRINASGLSQVWATGELYFPSWMELSVSVGIVSAFALLFFAIQEHFPVDPEALESLEAERGRLTGATPRFSPFTQVWLGEGWRRDAKAYSLLFVIAFAAGFTWAPKTEPKVEMEARRGRGGAVLRLGVQEPFVYFEHVRHQERLGGNSSCGQCHHLHMVGDVGTPCSECHRSMYTPTDIFDHGAHVAALEGNLSCVRCHDAAAKTAFAAGKTCSECHRKDMMEPNPSAPHFAGAVAVGYREAMHGMCAPCHARKAADPALARPDLGRCGTCHNEGTAPERAYRLASGARQGSMEDSIR